VRQRPDKRVDARADVLEVDDEQIEAVEHLRRRLARLGVETVHGHAEPLVGAVAGLDHVVLLARPEAVLGTEQRLQRAREPRVQHLGGVPETAVDRSLVAEQTETTRATQHLGWCGAGDFENRRGQPPCDQS
jgi:hypothetical protein